MKSKTLAFATLLMATALLLIQVIAPHAALAAANWTNISGGMSSFYIESLAYDSVHNVVYVGALNTSVGIGGVWACPDVNPFPTTP